MSHLSVHCHKTELNLTTRKKFMPLTMPTSMYMYYICLASICITYALLLYVLHMSCFYMYYICLASICITYVLLLYVLHMPCFYMYYICLASICITYALLLYVLHMSCFYMYYICLASICSHRRDKTFNITLMCKK